MAKPYSKDYQPVYDERYTIGQLPESRADQSQNGSLTHKIVDDVVKKVVTNIVHEFKIGDSDDPDIYAGQPLWEWQQSEAGKWVMSKALQTPSWHRFMDHNCYSYQYKIIAQLYEDDALYFTLKFK